jgi:hypothetical protein
VVVVLISAFRFRCSLFFLFRDALTSAVTSAFAVARKASINTFENDEQLLESVLHLSCPASQLGSQAAKHTTAQHSTPQHSTAQHSTACRSTACRSTDPTSSKEVK